MTREEIDKVIEDAEKIRKTRVDWQDNPPFSTGIFKQCEFYTFDKMLSAIKQLRDENADLTNRLTDAQDFINDRIEKGRR